MISDSELLQMLMQKYPSMDAEYVMHEFSLYKKLLNSTDTCADNEQASNEPVDVPAVEPVMKKLTKRQIKFNPQEAVSETHITCCVCGQKFKRLSAAHLATHGATPEEYRKICGYEPNQPLMGKEIYSRLMSAVKSAQEARARKRSAAAEGAPLL